MGEETVKEELRTRTPRGFAYTGGHTEAAAFTTMTTTALVFGSTALIAFAVLVF